MMYRRNSSEASSLDEESLEPASECTEVKAPKSNQAGQLQRLGQPYFLPLGRAGCRSGLHFLWLLAALISCVLGALLVLLTATLHLAVALESDSVESVIAAPMGGLDALWRGIGGPVIMALASVGVLSFAFFRNELQGRWGRWGLLGLIVIIVVSMNLVVTGFGFVANYLTQALVERDSGSFWGWLGVYAALFVFALPVLTLQFFFKAKLGINWREWLASSLIEGWMSHRAYYVLNSNDEEAAGKGVDNPDQRISQDVDTFTKMTLEYLVGTIDSLVMFSMNIMVLWSISPTMTTVLVSWSVGMTALILFLSKFLVRVNYVQLKLEADFRYSLVHVRNNAESIAFYGGESPERSEMSGRLSTLVENYNKLIKWTVGISVVDKLYNYGNEFVPFFLMGPEVLLGTLTFGQFYQATFTFRLVQNALTFIAQSINAPGGSNTMTQWIAGISRLEGFQAAVEQVSVKGEGASEFHVSRQGADVLVRGAELRTPGTGQLVVSGLNLSLKRSERLLVVGPSGCGKTSLLRMICGLWQPAAGQLEAPPVGEMLFVPQKPYMVLGSLREQLSYPQGEGAFSDDQMRQALEEVCLGHFVERYPDLGVKQDWARLMSLGEQQRLSFARVLLNAPSFVVLDEASSGLDVATERKLYGLLVQRGTGFMSVGHRPTLKSFHTGVLELKGAPTGGWQLLPADSYEFSA